MPTKIVFVALFTYDYQNFSVRTLHHLSEKSGANAYTIFLKQYNMYSFEQPTYQEQQLFLDTIKQISPDIISFTVLSPFVEIARHLSKMIKENLPNTTIIWGGMHPTISPEDCFDDADFVCVGEGEGAIIDLIQCVGKHEQNSPDLKIANLNGEPPRKIIEDINEIPSPLYGSPNFYFIDNNTITRKDPAITNGNYYIQTSRGCPWQCTFCSNSIIKTMFKGLGKFIRRKSVESVINEINEFKKMGNPRYVYFMDEVFASDLDWLKEFCFRYKTEVGLPFFAEYHPKQLSSEKIDLLLQAGLDQVCIGVQSGSDIIRNEIYRRPETNEEIILLSRQLHTRGIKIIYDFILNNPYETEKSLSATIELLTQLPHPLNFQLFSLVFFPKYPITEKALNDRLIVKINSDFEFMYIPKLFPISKTNKLQNLIWLVANNVMTPSDAKKAIDNSFFLLYSHIKSVLFVKSWKLLFGNPYSYCVYGDYKMLMPLIKKRYFSF